MGWLETKIGKDVPIVIIFLLVSLLLYFSWINLLQFGEGIGMVSAVILIGIWILFVLYRYYTWAGSEED